MALVLSTAGLQQLQDQLPTPALVQEFVNHGGQQYKVYVMGEQVCAQQYNGRLPLKCAVGCSWGGHPATCAQLAACTQLTSALLLCQVMIAQLPGRAAPVLGPCPNPLLCTEQAGSSTREGSGLVSDSAVWKWLAV
jgi:hypothetical protein